MTGNDTPREPTGLGAEQATTAASDEQATTAASDEQGTTAASDEQGTTAASDEQGTTVASDDDPTAEPAVRSGLRRVLLPVLLALLLVVSATAATWSYLGQFRHDQAVGEAVATRAIEAARDGTVALLSYAPDTLDKDFTTAKTHLTGDFLNYYTQFTAEIVTPAAKQKSVKTAATVEKSAMIDLQPGKADVLLFVNQTTTSKENPAGSFTASSVKVGLTKVGGDWLISAFDPV